MLAFSPATAKAMLDYRIARASAAKRVAEAAGYAGMPQASSCVGCCSLDGLLPHERPGCWGSWLNGFMAGASSLFE